MSRGWGQNLLSGQQAQFGAQEVPSEHEEKLLYCKGDGRLEQAV